MNGKEPLTQGGPQRATYTRWSSKSHLHKVVLAGVVFVVVVDNGERGVVDLVVASVVSLVSDPAPGNVILNIQPTSIYCAKLHGVP